MNKIEGPALFLSFDDWWVKEWVATLPLLDKYNARVTFYVTFRSDPYEPFWDSGDIRTRLGKDYWADLRELRRAGHTIAFHTVNHLRVDTAMQQLRGDYERVEIRNGLGEFRRRRFRVRHFAYPYGFQNGGTQARLLPYFDTLRIATLRNDPKLPDPYPVDSLPSCRTLYAVDYMDARWKEYMGRVMESGGAGFVFGHNPRGTRSQLVSLLDFCYVNHVSFYPMSVLDATP